jgi:hypothetical protein
MRWNSIKNNIQNNKQNVLYRMMWHHTNSSSQSAWFISILHFTSLQPTLHSSLLFQYSLLIVQLACSVYSIHSFLATLYCLFLLLYVYYFLIAPFHHLIIHYHIPYFTVFPSFTVICQSFLATNICCFSRWPGWRVSTLFLAHSVSFPITSPLLYCLHIFYLYFILLSICILIAFYILGQKHI